MVGTEKKAAPVIVDLSSPKVVSQTFFLSRKSALRKIRCKRLTSYEYRAIYFLSTFRKAFFSFTVSESYKRVRGAEQETAVQVHRIVAEKHLAKR